MVVSCLDLRTSPEGQWCSVLGVSDPLPCSCRVPPFPSSRRPFSLADLNDYETHCTVMNYREDAVLKNILYDEFVPLFEQQYPDHPWREVEVRRHKQCNTHRESRLLIVLLEDSSVISLHRLDLCLVPN